MKLTVNGYDYVLDQNGLHQVNPSDFKYDASYVSTYDTPEYKIKSDILQGLRLGFVIGSHGSVPRSILDFGYGNGAFLKFAAMQNQTGLQLYGHGVSGVNLNDNRIRIVDSLEYTDVYTFWDALEHVKDLSFVKKLPCKTICVSLPWCHFSSFGKSWLESWKHLKPNEHLHHFNPSELSHFMKSMGWETVSVSNHEDIIRVGQKGLPNILSMSFKRVK